MSFKNMKRDDHGHVIGNDETDGQKCQHGAGGKSKPSIDYDEIERRKNDPRFQKDKMAETPEEVAAYLKEKGGELVDFDGDYEEEFNDNHDEGVGAQLLGEIEEASSEEEKAKLEDRINIAYNQGQIDKQEHLALLDKLFNDDEFEDESQEEYEARIKPEAEKFKKQLNDAGYKLKDKEYGVEKKPQESSIDKYNRMVGLESQMHSKIDNARKNGQSPQQVLDSVAYDMDIQPGTEEYDRLKTLVMYDTRMNKDTGQYEYNKYNSGSNKQVTGDERKKLQDLSDAFKKAGLENKLEDTWEDYGAKMGMTNLIHNDVQVLNPKDWIDYMNGNASIEEIIGRVKNSPYKSAYKWKEPQKETTTDWHEKGYMLGRDNGLSDTDADELANLIYNFMKNKGK